MEVPMVARNCRDLLRHVGLAVLAARRPGLYFLVISTAVGLHLLAFIGLRRSHLPCRTGSRTAPSIRGHTRQCINDRASTIQMTGDAVAKGLRREYRPSFMGE